MNIDLNHVNGHPRPVSPFGPEAPTDRPGMNTDRSGVNTRRSVGKSGEDGGKKPSAATRLVGLARERYTFVMSTDARPYAVAIDGPNLALPLRGRARPGYGSGWPACTPTRSTGTSPRSRPLRTP